MSKPRKLRKTTRDDLAEVQQYNDLNVARLGLISVQRQISDDFVHWESEYEQEAGEVKITCSGKAGLGVPHGTDSDIYNAIVHLYITKGAPPNGRVTFTIYEILKTCGMQINARSYGQVRDALKRLVETTYYIAHGWRDHTRKRWLTLSFRHLENLIFTENSEHQLDNATIISVQIHESVVHNVRSGYYLPLEDSILKNTTQPTARSLYRLLEAQRRDPLDPSRLQPSLTFSVATWGSMCKLSADRPDKIRRSLDNSHSELINNGYLKNVTFSGRGKTQTITYQFQPQAERIIDPNLVELLMEHGMAPGVARNLVSRYPERIRDCVERFVEITRNNQKISNPPGFLYKIIENPEQYLKPTKAALTENSTSNSKNNRLTTAKLPTAEDDPLEARIEGVIYMLQVSLDKKVSVVELDVLRNALATGTLPIETFSKEITTLYIKHDKEGINGMVRSCLLDLQNQSD